MHIYQDAERAVPERVQDLMARMTLEDKAGQLFHTAVSMKKDGSLVEAAVMQHAPTSELVLDRKITHFNLAGGSTPRAMAEWHNQLQSLAMETRLGIPITLSSDPRNSFSDTPGVSLSAGSFSQWPEALGLAAARDTDLVRAYADVVRQEYLAVGIRVALHPQVDLATEPRWPRILGTFGEDAELTSRLVVPYVEGMRGGTQLGPHSVSCMVKHFPGGGPQKDGRDPHFPSGREQVYPGGHFDYHLGPFRAAIAAGVTQIMPYYGMPVGTEFEEVGFGFNRGTITGLLREKLGFDGIVCTDWMLINDKIIDRKEFDARVAEGWITSAAFEGDVRISARAWGVEHLTPDERVLKALNAGVDQFGGEACPELIIGLVRDGDITELRLDESVHRILTEKFTLGLFDKRFVDPDGADEVVGSARFRDAAATAQRRSITVLENRDDVLPVRCRPLLYTEGIDPTVASRYAELVESPAAADVAILCLATPWEPRTGELESTIFHTGSLEFPPEDLKSILAILDSVPTIVAIHLERPAVIPEIADRCAALLGTFGLDDHALLDVLFGRARPEGKLPFQLLRSMDDVIGGKADVPRESKDPLYDFGHGLCYP